MLLPRETAARTKLNNTLTDTLSQRGQSTRQDGAEDI